MLESYGAQDVSVSLYGYDLTGFADGTFLDLKWNTSTITTRPSVSGRVSATRAGNASGTVTLSLLQQSLSNSMMETLYMATLQGDKDYIGNTENRMLIIRDNSTDSYTVGVGCYVAKASTRSYSNSAKSTSWEITCEKLIKIPKRFDKNQVGVTTGVNNNV